MIGNKCFAVCQKLSGQTHPVFEKEKKEDKRASPEEGTRVK